jgi:predicted AlkP superfamily phosphohydrolase/phosphomutase
LSRVSTPKVTVIGLDAATFDVIDPLLEAGDLPNLGRLFEGGAKGVLRSVTHPLTPHAWSTMTTGVNAGRHGIWDFTQRVDGGYGLRIVNGSYRRAPALWDRLTAAGVRSALVSIPFTWPAPAIDGCVVSGFDAADRDEGFTHPHNLLAELRDRFGTLVLDHRFPLGKGGALDLDLVRRAAEQKAEIALWLADRCEAELLFVVFMAADHVQHLCWDDWERLGRESLVADVYRVLDAATGRLADVVGDGDVMVVSDHGGGALNGVVSLNTFLEERGFLAYRGGRAALGRKAASRLFGVRRMFPERLRTAVKRRLPALRERAYEATAYTVVDWARTRAFAYGTFGNVVINLRGREREGIVARHEYDAVRSEVADALGELRGREGEEIVRAVHRREDLFYGPELEKVPDLIVEFEDYAWLGKGNLQSSSASLWDRIEIEPGSPHVYVGSHRTEGIVALAGPSAAAGAAIAADIADVTPTVLYLLGQPLPSDLDGRLITEALDPDLLTSRPPEYSDEELETTHDTETYAPEDERAVEERLRSLGYLE